MSSIQIEPQTANGAISVKVESITENLESSKAAINQLISISEVLIKLIELRATSVKVGGEELKIKLKIKREKQPKARKPTQQIMAEPLLDLARSMRSHCLEDCRKELVNLPNAEVSTQEKYKRYQAIKNEIDLVHRKLDTLFDHSIIPISMRGKCAHIILPKIGHQELKEEADSNAAMIVNLLRSIDQFVEDAGLESSSSQEESAEQTSVKKLLQLDVLDPSGKADAIIGAMTAIELRRLRIEELYFEDQKRRRNTVRAAAIYIALLAILVFVIPSVVAIADLIMARIHSTSPVLADSFQVGLKMNHRFPLLGVPTPVILWSLLGSFSATIHRFNRNSVYYFDNLVKWMLTRHIQGVMLSAAFYLIFISGLFLITAGSTSNNSIKDEIIMVLSFLIGFSDRFVDSVFENLINKFSKNEQPTPVVNQSK